MRPIKSIKALANNMPEQGIREAFHRLDEGQQELAASIARLASGQLPTTAGTLVVGQPGTSGGGSTGVGEGKYADIEVSSAGAVWRVVSHGDVKVLPSGTNLQNVINDLPTGPSILQLGRGTYYGPGGSSVPATQITVPSNKAIQIRGLGVDATTIKSPILFETSRFGLMDLAVKPAGTTFGVKVFRNGNFLSRGTMDRVWIGASYLNAGDGPQRGLILDGAGLFLAHGLTIAFCTSDGLYVDSTHANAPNTTLKFDMCTFNQNGHGALAGYGVRLENSLSIAEFNGGNAEDNYSGEFYANNLNSVYVHGMDFERGADLGGGSRAPLISYMAQINSVNPSTMRDCNFIQTNSTATQGLIVQAGAGHVIESNRFSGYGAVGVIRVTPQARQVRCTNNLFVDSNYGYIEDYST